jgi:hypothetical protein
LAPSLSSPHLFVKPSTFSLLLNCFSPSSLHPSVFHSLSSSFSHHSGCSAHAQTNKQPSGRSRHTHTVPKFITQAVREESRFRGPPEKRWDLAPFPWGLGRVRCCRPERHGCGGWCAA